MRQAPRSALAAHCECADCRQYRLWRVEGTDEWQPDRDDWNARSVAAEAYAIDVDAGADPRIAETLATY